MKQPTTRRRQRDISPPDTHDADRSLRARRRPVQSRSQRSVRKVLDAALRILAQEGLPGLNTNKVAAEAGLNVATLYAYFPDKLAIVARLVDEYERKRSDYVIEQARILATSDWRAWHTGVIDELAQIRTNEPGGVALRKAVMSSPDLKHLDEESTDQVVRATHPGILAHSRDLTESRAWVVSRTVAVTITAMLDDAFRASPCDTQQIAELKLMIIDYLARYLD